MKSAHKFELGNLVKYTNIKGQVVEGLITDRGFNLMSWEPDYDITSKDGITHIGVEQECVTLIESGEHRTEQEIKDHNMYEALKRLMQ